MTVFVLALDVTELMLIGEEEFCALETGRFRTIVKFTEILQVLTEILVELCGQGASQG